MAFCMRSRTRGFTQNATNLAVKTATPVTPHASAVYSYAPSTTARSHLYPALSPSAPSVEDIRSQKTLVCYVPTGDDVTPDDTVLTCTLDKSGSRIVYLTDPRAATIPSGAIVDSIEFFGYDGFATKGKFSIGLGQVNTAITFPLVLDTDSSIANERVGGCIDFFSVSSDGKTLKNIVLCSSNVNVDLEEPITNGGLQIVIRYHMKHI